MKKKAQTPAPTPGLRDDILRDFGSLRVPLRPEHLDAALARATHDGLSHLEFLQLLIGEQAQQRASAASPTASARPASASSQRWPTSTGSSTPRPSTARRSRRWPAATLSAGGRTSSWSGKAAWAKAI